MIHGRNWVDEKGFVFFVWEKGSSELEGGEIEGGEIEGGGLRSVAVSAEDDDWSILGYFGEDSP